MPHFLDDSGVTYLWNKLSLQDYPNNETLVSVINAIDETKADTSDVVLKEEKGVRNGVVPLNASTKIEATYLPNYTDVGYVPSDDVAGLTIQNKWQSEQTFNYVDYNLYAEDRATNVAAGFKCRRGLFNQLLINDFVFTRADNTATSGMAEAIGFYVWDTTAAIKATYESDGVTIKTPGSSILQGYRCVAAVTNDGGLVLKSSTPGSSKFFKITVDDTGTISANEYTFQEENTFEVAEEE